MSLHDDGIDDDGLTMDVDAGPSSAPAGETAGSASASNSERSARTRLLHRVRFVDWNPSAVTAIAVTPITWNPTSSAYPYASSSRGVLAIARQNGNIEIYTWLADQSQKPARTHAKANAAKKPESGRWVLEKVKYYIASKRKSRM
jgi:U3 small nucleolar RNA-associated protein 4